MIGPTTAETLRARLILENTMPENSSELPAHSYEALVHVDVNPPLCIPVLRQ